MLFIYFIIKGQIGYMPELSELENPIDRYASTIYGSDGSTLGNYAYSKDNRTYVGYDQLSPDLVNALIATEDERYHSHSGIDFRSLFRTLIKTGILQQRNSGGGSTITQQLAKQLYSPQAGNLLERAMQKPIEWVIAVELERMYTKEEILSMYLNKFDFLYNAVGIKSAAKAYFDTTPAELTLPQAATLVGMCKNPSYFNPVRRPEQTTGRRNVVLDQMGRLGYITTEMMVKAKAEPMKLDFQRIDHKDGLAPYFREFLRKIMSANEPDRKNYREWQRDLYTDDSLAWETNPLYGWCNKNVKADGSKYDLYTDGLRIYTAINPTMQQYAEEEMANHMGNVIQPTFQRLKGQRPTAPYPSDMSKEMVDDILTRSMRITDRYRTLTKQGLDEAAIRKNFDEPVEMKVFSWGSGEKDTVMTPWDSIRYHKMFLRSGFMSMEANTGHVKAYVGGIDFRFFQYDMVTRGRRQIGSTVKPFLYALAMEEGYSPCDMVPCTQQVIGSWAPRGGVCGGHVTLRQGLATSNNQVSAFLIKNLSVTTFADLLHTFGLGATIDAQPPLCLGTCDASVGEMVAAYTSFVNKGVRLSPVFVTRILDSNGNIISTFTPNASEVMSEEVSYKMIDVMQSVINEGTGRRMRRLGVTAPMGGKTGTTQNQSDGWFVCYTPELIQGCWVGGEERSIHFDQLSQGQGASMALPIVANYLRRVYEDNTLPYSQETEFDISEEFNPCYVSPQPAQVWIDQDGDYSSSSEESDELIEW